MRSPAILPSRIPLSPLPPPFTVGTPHRTLVTITQTHHALLRILDRSLLFGGAKLRPVRLCDGDRRERWSAGVSVSARGGG